MRSAIFTKSPEGQMLVRYGIMLVLWVVGSTIAPHAAATGALWVVIWIGTVVSARIVLVAPHRFAFRRTTSGLRATWWLFLGEIALLAVAFVLALDDRGSVAGAWTALAVAIGCEVIVSRLDVAGHRRIGTIVPTLRIASLDADWQLNAESWGGANDEFKRILGDAFGRVATVLRAYLVTATYRAERRRVLALRFAYLWSDDDAIRIAQLIFGQLFTPGDVVHLIMLDEPGEARVRAVAAPFYQRVSRRDVRIGSDDGGRTDPSSASDPR